MVTTPNEPESMREWSDKLLDRLNPKAIRTSSPVQCVMSEDGGFTVSAGYNSDHFDAVILATPAPAAAMILRFTLPSA